MPSYASESDLEQAALTWFAALGYEVLDHENLDPDTVYKERTALDQVLLEPRLRAALDRLNPDAPVEAFDEALRILRRQDAPTLLQRNLTFHRFLTDGITVEVAGEAGGTRGLLIRLVDPDHLDANDWMVTSQMDIVDRATGTGHARRPDILVYVNGLPLAVLELKSPTDKSAGVDKAYTQLQTYAKDIPSLFVTNCVLVISDDVHARIGPLEAPFSRFAPWRTIGGKNDESADAQPLQTLIAGVFAKKHFLDLCQSFITFEHDRGKIVKKLAGYHQFHAVRVAVARTIAASGKDGDQKIGVVWHTQGSGKSLTMVFYAGKLVRDPRMANPTIVVLTDRNDLDDQLFATFAQAHGLLRQEPEQARDRDHLRALLKTTQGGVFFTTAQKFLPPDGDRLDKTPLSLRRNIIVIADEAHRSQYGFKEKVDPKTGKKTWGFAIHLRDALPAASFIGFTGTPVDLKDRNTEQVFGDTISIYDIQRSVEDHATVPIYYEARQTRLDLDETERPHIDPSFEEATESEEVDQKEALKSEWSAVEAVAGTRKRVALVAADLVAHFEKRLGVIEGKALVVCMSRRICVELYEAIRLLRPAWHDDDDDAGALKVVMTGSAADKPELGYGPHVRTKSRRARLAERYKDPSDPLKMVIVRDMWLTGFDAPCMHTLYVDKPMQGHGLLQAIARVNRVMGNKPGGLVVDYFGLEESLKQAVKSYTENGGKGKPKRDQSEAIKAMLGNLDILRDLFHAFDYQPFFEGGPAERLAVLPKARNHVLGLRAPRPVDEPRSGKKTPRAPDDYDRFQQAVADLSAAFSLSMPNEACETIRSEVAFFQAVKAGLQKLTAPRGLPSTESGQAVREIVENAIVPGVVVDVFEAAGVAKPNLSVLSATFLAQVQAMPERNLAAELLRRLLEDEVATRSRRSLVQGKSFADMLESAILRYRNRSIEAAAVIAELIDLAQKMVAADERAGKLRLTPEESAFYDALADNRSAVEKLGDEGLSKMARELTVLVRKNATLDWSHKESVKAHLRRLVKRLLRDYGYPPDATEKATLTVLEQAKALRINMDEDGSEATGDLGAWADPPEAPAAATSPAPAAKAPPPPPKPLPYPIAVFDSLVESQETAILRVKTRRDGVERVLIFLVAASLGILRDAANGQLPEAALTLLQRFVGTPISMGAWQELAWRLAAELPASSTDPAARAARSLVTPDGKQSALAKEIAAVVPERNTFSHAVIASEEALVDDEAPLHALWKRIKEALAPLSECELVSQSSIVDFNHEARTSTYKVRMHQGPADLFPIEQREISGRIEKGWCYLLREGRSPLSLAPVVRCAVPPASGVHELFMARQLELAPGAKVDLLGVKSDNKIKVILPA
ncbi:MAG: type I restriction endonuclease subunit R [Byssovorax sp.]